MIRVVGLTTSGTPASKAVLDTPEADALTVANMDGDAHSDIALVHDAGMARSWLELRRAVSFGYWRQAYIWRFAVEVVLLRCDSSVRGVGLQRAFRKDERLPNHQPGACRWPRSL